MSEAPSGAGRRVALALRIGVGLALIGVLLWSAGPRRLVESLGQLSLGYLGLAFFAQAIAKLIWALRWQEVLRVSGIHKGMVELLAMLHVGFFFNNFLPSSMGGDLVRGYYSSQGKGTLATAYGVILAERLLGLVALTAVCALAIALWLAGGNGAIPRPFLWSCLLASAGVCAVATGIFWSQRWREGLKRRLAAHPRLSNVAAQVGNAVQFLHRPGCRVAFVVALSVLVQVVAVLFYYATARAVGIELEAAAFFFVVPLSVVASMVPLSPNGIGLREGAFVGLLQLLGVAAPAATAFALLARGVDLAFGLIGGAIFVLNASFKKPMTEVRSGAPEVRSGTS